MTLLRTATALRSVTAAAPRIAAPIPSRWLSSSTPRAIAATIASRSEVAASSSQASPSSSSSPTTASSAEAAGVSLPASSLLNLRPPPITTLGYTKDNLPTLTDPTLSFFVGILMRDGKRAASNRVAMDVLALLYDWTSSPPLPMFQQAITRASPLVRMQSSKSGGKIVQIPIPLNPRQSMHRGIKAIIDASKKRNDRYLPTRLAREIIAVLEGSSSVLSRKEEQHKVAMANRANASVRI